MKLKKTVICLSSLIFITLGMAFAGCNVQETPVKTPENVYGDGVTVGGETAGNEKQFFTIENAEDIHVSKGGEISAAVSKVVAVCGNDREKVDVDDSKVDLTKSGKYPIVYSYKDVIKSVYVCVYEKPTIVDEKAGQTISTSYSNTYKDVFDGITASVVRGTETVELDVKLETQDFIRSDGSIDISNLSKTLTFFAESPTGEIVKLTRNVTIENDMVAPDILASYTYDVLDDNLVFENVDEDTVLNFLTVSVNEKPLTNILTVDEDSVSISGQGLYDLFGLGGDNTLRFVTSNGYAEAVLNIVDEKPVALNTDEVKEFIDTAKVNGKKYELPFATLANPRQSEKISFRLLKEGEVITDKVEAITLNAIGTYTLEYTARGKSTSFDFLCFNNLGLQGNVMFTMDKKFDYTLAEGYELLKYTVREDAGIVAYYDVESALYNDLNAFYTVVSGLNKSKVYKLEVYARCDMGIFSQTIDFTVGGEGIVDTISGANSLELGRVNTHNILSLDYRTTNLGGRLGAFKWYFHGEKTAQTESIIRYSDEIAASMTTGKYVTFDVYCNSELNLSWYDNGNVTSFYTKGYRGAYSPEIAYYVDGVRYTGLDSMNQISGGYLGKWVTIELHLTQDFAGGKTAEKFNNTWNGLFVIGNYNNLRDYDNYIANMKISTYSFMQDDTENVTFEPRLESEGTGEDVWHD
ncbi:MAG: hypothetical protein IJX75_02615 [Clostridia bacterium]|nr:hypothetical protein [Clostridia bacterium]